MQNSEYNFSKIEPKWQKYWSDNKTFKAIDFDSRPKFYILDMFPYPSGAGLHIGHPEGYTASDAYKRFRKSQGYNVLHPMGWDAFGLPTEQYAIKTGKHPKETTQTNVENFKQQLKQIGLCYDWEREINTTDPNYFKWTQWIFIQLFRKGLAYVEEKPVWFCPDLGTVLANEEVLQTNEGARSERGNFPVERRPIRQWVLHITKFADKLLKGLDNLDWPDSTKRLQANWIGRSEGAKVSFAIEDNPDERIEVFTTRPDTLFGASYVVLAPEHPLIPIITTTKNKKEIDQYIYQTSMKSDLERQESEKSKTGVFTGAYALNPMSKKKIPIWISDYVLYSYGPGAIMAVPAHDERDYEFAKKFNLEITRVIEGGDDVDCHTGNGKIINSENYNGLDNQEFKIIAVNFLEKQKKGEKKVNYKLRDWIFTRQRYWGEPIPILYDGEKKKDLDYEDLPLKLPEVESYLPTKDGSSPLARNKNWVNVQKDGKKYLRETNTMPQWAGSCWYFLRFLDPLNDNEFANKDIIKYWMPVDLYIGGAEHAVLHLLYARFWHKVLFDLSLVNTSEPFKKLVNQGMILGNSAFIHRIKNTNDFISFDLINEHETQKIHVDISMVDEKNNLDIKKLQKSNPEFKDVNFVYEKSFTVSRDIEKMSKSRYNVVSPDEICKKYGADTLRLYEMFLGPIDQSKPWNTSGITGVFSFLNKFWNLFHTDGKFHVNDEKPNDQVLKAYHKVVKKVNSDIENFSFNTSVSAFMICINELSSLGCKSKDILSNLCILLSPFAPHICEELWSLLGNKTSISYEKFPVHDEKYLIESMIEYPVSFNGKLRFKINLSTSLKPNEVEDIIKNHQSTEKYLNGNSIKKIIFVPKKIINIVC